MGSGPGGLGATRYRWRRDVSAVIQSLQKDFPRARPNTYVCHPWCGWGRVSVDWWGVGGRGDPIPFETGERLLKAHRTLSWGPAIRHTIWIHSLWTSWGGYSWWAADDHSGALRHVHVTFWK